MRNAGLLIVAGAAIAASSAYGASLALLPIGDATGVAIVLLAAWGT